MNYYTATIPPTLAEKLKEKGMPIEKESDNTWCPSYAEVLDWLMEKDIVMEQTRLFGLFHIRPIIFGENKELMPIKDFCKAATWHEAAEKAIEKALELI